MALRCGYTWKGYRAILAGRHISYSTEILKGIVLNSFRDKSESTRKVPVIIVGAGPVGLTLSYLLSKLGIRSLVVEKNASLTDHPQAHFINNRTMEIFRYVDGLAEEITKLQPPLSQWRRFVYCLSMTGSQLGKVDHFKNEALHPLAVSPTTVAHFSQNKLLPLLLQRSLAGGYSLQTSRHAVKVPAVESDARHAQPFSSMKEDVVLMGHLCTGFKSGPAGIIATISPSSSGLPSQDSFQIEAEYLIGADGANSRIRQLAGIRMDGDPDIQQLINVHFKSKQLGQRLLKENPAMLYFIFNTDVIAVVVAHDLEAGDFVAQLPFYPPQQRIEDFTPQVCADIIRSAAGINSLEVIIRSVRHWTMNARVAQDFVAGPQGRIILAGDAAHHFPPAGGFGMNSGIQDAHNLAWKLAAVLRGLATSALLSTYHKERHQVATANTKLSIANFQAAMAIPSALGLDPQAAKLVQSLVNSPPINLLPMPAQRAALEQVMNLGRSQLASWMLHPSNPVGRARLAEVERILQSGESLQLQFLAEDLGVRYFDGAVSQDASDNREDETLPTGRRRDYVPSSLPGSRLPHCDVIFHHPEGTKVRMSTLDFGSGLALKFHLIVSASPSGMLWHEAVRATFKKMRIPLCTAVFVPCNQAAAHSHILEGFKSHSDMSRTRANATHDYRNPSVEGEGSTSASYCMSAVSDEVIIIEDSSESLWKLCGTSSEGAILVRPDGHVGWRSLTPPPSSDGVLLEKITEQAIRLIME